MIDLCTQGRILEEPEIPARATREPKGKKSIMKEFTRDSVLGAKRPGGCSSLDHRHLEIWEDPVMRSFVQDLNITMYALWLRKGGAQAQACMASIRCEILT